MTPEDAYDWYPLQERVGILELADAGAIDLAYAVDSLEGSVMVRLSTVSLDLTRLYTLDGEVAVPTGPVSVMRRHEVDPA